MAVSPQEQHKEELVRLRQLSHSPEWALYQAQLAQLKQRNEVEKAQALRAGKLHEAVLLQGRGEGIKESSVALDKMIQVLSSEGDAPPAY